MRKVFFDIETAPLEDEKIIKHLKQKAFKKYMKKVDDGELQFCFDRLEKETNKMLREASLNAAFGQVVSIGWNFDDDLTIAIGQDDEFSEKDVIQGFFAEFRRIKNPLLAGFNLAFDRGFLWRRSLILGIDCPLPFSMEVKPWEDKVHDIMMKYKMSDFSVNVSLDDLCVAFGIEGKQGVDGSDVAKLFKEKRFEEIIEYNRHDVKITKEIYYKVYR
jgi:predicted PolB exonuclease-like 3'-5' exonuclease